MEMAAMRPYGLEVVRVTSNGRRYHGRAGKARLVEACLEPAYPWRGLRWSQRSGASTARDQIGTLRGIKSECLRAMGRNPH
jgi:hypothetical protein